MGLKTMTIAGVLGGSLLLSGLTFTGTLNLTDIKNFGTDWANKLTLAVDNSKDLASQFNLFKSDVQEKLNEKIALINDLNAQIEALNAQVGTGEMDLETANNELQRLNFELEKANQEIEVLKNEFATKDTEVQAKFNEMVMADSLDTTLNLDEQTGTPAPTEPETEPENETPEQTETVDYTAKENDIKTGVQTKFPTITDLQVTVTETTVTLSSSTQAIHLYSPTDMKNEVQKALGKNIALSSTETNKIYYSINK